MATAGRGEDRVYGEADRQAIDSLGGYAHQLLASAVAWVRLPLDAELHLEVAEDYATALCGRLDATQVKRSAGTVSLAAEPVRTAIRSFVRLVRLNPGRLVRLTFLTTAEIATEHQLAHRTGDVPGLRRWQEVADGAEIGRLREVLLALDLEDEVHRFIRSRDDDALRRDLVQCIDWRCGEADTKELGKLFQERVAELCLHEFDVSPLEGEQRADNVVQQVLRTCVRRTDRVLTHTGLRVTLRRATDVGVDRRTFNALMTAAGPATEGHNRVRRAAGWSAESVLPLPPPLNERPRKTGDIHARLLNPNRIGQRIGPGDLLDTLDETSEQPEAFGSAKAERVRRVLGSKSATLLRWPTTIAGQWLDRPELAGMLEHLSAPSPPALVLLGPPGSGKSAIMAKLGAELAARGATLLAIKADALPRGITSVAALGGELEVPSPLDECLIRLSMEGPVVLLIDQLDALADLMDQHGGRLGALLSLVALVRSRPNLAVILSSREFEFRHDARLTSLDAIPMRLSLPPWEAIQPVLEKRGFQPTGWHAEFREVLRRPQHLDLFLSHLAGDGEGAAYRSYHDMLEEVFQKRILRGATGREDGDALHSVARAMVEEEDLWVASARFDGHVDAIRRLEASGFLIRDGRKIGFRHQTLFDFVRARAFVADGESVVDYALARQETIFARPTVWSALSYLRASDPVSYERQLRRLWAAEGLRPHMRWLLRDFVGQQVQPSNEEARLLLPALAGEEAVRTLRSMSGSAGWFDRLQPRMPGLMASPDPLGWACAAFLRSVIRSRGEAVLALVAAHWMADPNQRRTYLVLDGMTEWTEATADVAERIAGSLDNWSIIHLAKAAGDRVPHRVPGLLLRKLDAILAAARAQPSTGGALARFFHEPGGFHGFGKTLARTPENSVRTLWPWFAAVAAETVASHRHRGRYRHDDGTLLERYGARDHVEDHPGPAFANAIASWARAAPDAFLEFARAMASTDLEALHLLLAEGFKAVAGHRPVAVLGYLLEDERRLRLGNLEDESGVTKALIAAISPSLPSHDFSRLIAGVLRATGGRDLSEYERKGRLQVSKWIRREHLDLLMATPEACRTRDLAGYIREELRAVGEPFRRGSIEVIYGSDVRMTVAGMAKARDRDVLRFLGLHPDESGWGNPLEPRRNRSVDASRAFGDFAKEHPYRAMRLTQQVPPGNLERPVAHAITAMSEKGDVLPREIVEFVTSLYDRGFASGEFRDAAAYALARAGSNLDGLDDRVCEILTGWLGDYAPPEGMSRQGDDAEAKKKRGLHPILWGTGGIRPLPGGNYPILRALEVGLIRRNPPAANAWLAVLEEHLGRTENSEVWRALADELRFLWHADRDRTAAFFERLFDAQPSLTQGQEGVRLLAWTHRWLPSEFVHRRLRGWMESGWDQGRQAAGEFASLRALIVPDDAAVSGLLEGELTNPMERGETPDFLYGVACTMARLWAEASCRSHATTWIERLAAISDRKLAGALRPMFHAAQGKMWDAATERVLRACVDRPALLKADSHFLPQLLKEVLRDGLDPVLVGRLALGMIRGAGAEMCDPGSSWVSSASDLFEIATALQRIEGTKTIGTELFEEMLGAEVYGVGEQLSSFDRNRFS